MYQVVIADDDALIRSGLYYLNDWNAMGFQVTAMLEDGEDVLKYLEENRADVLLTDIRMFKVSGLQVAKVVKDKYPWMKVVLLSGYREFEYAREAMHQDVFEYLLKPINYDKLRACFALIKEDLDKAQYEKHLVQGFGEEAYDQVLSLTRTMSAAVLGEDQESWLVYANLKPMMQKAPIEIRQVLIKRLLHLLQTKLEEKDPGMAQEFTQKLMALDISEDADISSSLSELLCGLNDELVSRDLVSFAVKKTGDDSVKKACNYINNHLGDDFTYKDVSKYVHLSPRQFIRRFQSEMGENFAEYVQRQRLERAKKLLEEGKILPGDVGAAVGYHDDKHFQMIFKKYTGCTVREYLKAGGKMG